MRRITARRTARIGKIINFSSSHETGGRVRFLSTMASNHGGNAPAGGRILDDSMAFGKV
jgi:hypothetical protein